VELVGLFLYMGVVGINTLLEEVEMKDILMCPNCKREGFQVSHCGRPSKRDVCCVWLLCRYCRSRKMKVLVHARPCDQCGLYKYSEIVRLRKKLKEKRDA